MLPKVTLYHKETGEAIERFGVDAREILSSGEWGFEPPPGVVPAAAAVQPVSSAGDEPVKSPLRLMPGLTAAGEKFLHGYGVETLEELAQTPLHKLQVLPEWRALEIEDQEPIEEYLQNAASKADTKAAVATSSRRGGKATPAPAAQQPAG
jgi:hypothetical protein